MKSKIIILILIVFIVSTSFIGCRNTQSISVPAHSIPFLALVPESANNGNVKKASLNFWNLKNGKIIQTGKVIYTVTKTTDIKSKQAGYEDLNGDRPLYWDGKDCIILPSFFKSAANLYKRTETIEPPKGWKNVVAPTQVIVGKDVIMVRIPTNNDRDYKYTVKIWNGKEYIKKKLDLNYKPQDTNSQSFYPVAIGNDGSNLYILLVSGYYNLKTGMDMLLCTVNIKNWTSKWDKISVDKDADLSPANPPNPSNSIYFDRSFYVPGGCCGILSKVDIKKFICSKWNAVMLPQFRPKPNDIAPPYISIVGSFNDMILVQDHSGGERYICPFDKNGEVLGAIHFTNGNLETLDKEGNVLSNISMDKNSSLVFPKMNGGM